MRADEAASLATRPGTGGSLTPEVLRERWQEEEADQVGLPTGHALEAQVCNRVIPQFRPRLEWDDLILALVDPEDGLCSHRARFGEAHVVERVAAVGAGRLTVEAIHLAQAFLDSDEAVAPDRPPRPPVPAVLHRRPPPPRRPGPRPPRRPRRNPGPPPSGRCWYGVPSLGRHPDWAPTRPKPSRRCAHRDPPCGA